MISSNLRSVSAQCARRDTELLSNVTQTARLIQQKGDNRGRNSSQRSKKKRSKKQRHFPFVSRPPELLTSRSLFLYLSLSHKIFQKNHAFPLILKTCPSLSALCIGRVREKLGERGRRAIVVQYSSLLFCPPVPTLGRDTRVPRDTPSQDQTSRPYRFGPRLLVSNNSVRACATAPKNKSFDWPQHTLWTVSA